MRAGGLEGPTARGGGGERIGSRVWLHLTVAIASAVLCCLTEMTHRVCLTNRCICYIAAASAQLSTAVTIRTKSEARNGVNLRISRSSARVRLIRKETSSRTVSGSPEGVSTRVPGNAVGCLTVPRRRDRQTVRGIGHSVRGGVQVSIVSVIACGDMVAVEAQATARSIVDKVRAGIRAGHRVAVTVGAVVDG